MTERSINSRIAASLTLLSGTASLNSTGVAVSDDMNFDDWVSLGEGLVRIGSGVQWALGDWLNYGKERFPDRYETIARETGYEYQTLANFAWVANRIEPARRNPQLSFTHHKAVASVGTEDQDRLLAQADDEGMSSRQLEVEVSSGRFMENRDTDEGKPYTESVSPRGETNTPEPTRELPVKVTVSSGGAAKSADDDDTPDPLEAAESKIEEFRAELTAADKQIRQLQTELDAVTKDDKDRTIRAKSQQIAQLEARIQGLLNEKAAAVDKANYGEKKLKEIRKALGVERDRDIFDAIASLKLKTA